MTSFEYFCTLMVGELQPLSRKKVLKTLFSNVNTQLTIILYAVMTYRDSFIAHQRKQYTLFAKRMYERSSFATTCAHTFSPTKR